MTVLALTPTRLVYSHTDEHPADEDDGGRPQAETSTEAVRFSRISSVAVTRVVPDPASYVPGVTMPSEVVLTIGWNVLSHVELEPAHCGDESCEADHGYTGTMTADDLTMRVSEAADGEDAVRQVLAFAQALSEATSRAREAPTTVWPTRSRRTSQPTLPRYGESHARRPVDLAAGLAGRAGRGQPAGPGRRPTGSACWSSTASAGSCCASTRPPRRSCPSWPMTARPLTAGFPATTVTSLSSLGTGRPPGQHGMLGYQVAVPGRGRLLNALRWDQRRRPGDLAAGLDHLRAGRGGGHRRVPDRAGLVPRQRAVASRRCAARTTGPRTRSARWSPRPPRAAGDRPRPGHGLPRRRWTPPGTRYGCTSAAWRYQLGHVDKLAEQLAAALPQGTVLYVTADHGMVDVRRRTGSTRTTAPALRDGVALLGGEPRARHVYAEPGAAADVLAAWREILGSAGLGGLPGRGHRGRLVRPGGRPDGRPDRRRGGRAGRPVGAGRHRTEPRESALVGMHGSLTAADQLVPAAGRDSRVR